MKHFLFYIAYSFLLSTSVTAQDSTGYWHDKERKLRYHPEGNDFVITNGERRFTRALYGTNTAFRVEAGDLPEFALYLPGMGGNIKFGLMNNDSSKWLINAAKIIARYRPGSMLYEINDPLLNKGSLFITILAMGDAEGAIIKFETKNIPDNIKLVWSYGGVTGRKFSRDGDMGPDPESVFYMKPEYCKNNQYVINNNEFLLQLSTNKNLLIKGILPTDASVRIVNARHQQTPLLLLNSVADSMPVVAGELLLKSETATYFSFSKQDNSSSVNKDLATVFTIAETARKKIADRIKVVTPDPYINTIGAAIGIAADAIWESPSFMHGAIGWRMRLNGWRGAYSADVLGWHDRAREHFRAYAKSQLTTPDSGKIVADTALHLARQQEKLGTSVFSNGYISRNPNGDFRPHHYDMNLVFIDQLLWHFNWTGDTAFVKEMWPLLTRHLAWEKRNFDVDADGLYDAYAAIWASDALQYSGGAVTHSSAYNYRANKMASMLADIIGEDGSKYKREAEKILSAINRILWLKNEGHYAEFKDAMGLQLTHDMPALWSIYHSLDSDVADAFQSYQSMQYIKNYIPHIPIKAKGLTDGFYTISTSNWMPYTWSLNNVALAELMHTSLAGWQAGKNEEAFLLWKSSLMESMYLGGSPGNFQQISTYDGIRGEAYRDFADPVGMTSRSLVQGLFGILPDALKNKLTIKPGFPSHWEYASLNTPDILFDFKRTGKKDQYNISLLSPKESSLELVLKVNGNNISGIMVNGKKASWQNISEAIDIPMISIAAGKAKKYNIVIEWQGKLADENPEIRNVVAAQPFKYATTGLRLIKLYDPQQLFSSARIESNSLNAAISKNTGYKTAFVQVQQGAFIYWKAINTRVKQPLELVYDPEQKKNGLSFKIKNNTAFSTAINIIVNEMADKFQLSVLTDANGLSSAINVPAKNIIAGSNTVTTDDKSFQQKIINWNVDNNFSQHSEAVELSEYFNDKVSNIFKNKYLSPRPAVPTLQLPTQGIGDWTHPLLTANINDSGFRKAAVNDRFPVSGNLSFTTPADSNKKNIVFVSQWDNFPVRKSLPLNGKASHAYFLMAGSTNPMQSQFDNGKIVIRYTDGSKDSLILRNPENWWPIEQDYFNDGYAFNTKAARPVRIHLKTGKIYSVLTDPANEYNGKMIEGGAATVLDMPLNKNKILQSLTLSALANDVVIGLMGITLVR
jgi:hypothetical protein